MTAEPDFVSRQTHDARRFYLNLQPRDEQPLALVCGGVERMNDDYVVERTDFSYYAIEWVSAGRGILTIGVNFCRQRTLRPLTTRQIPVTYR